MSIFSQQQFDDILRGKGWDEVSIAVCKSMRGFSVWKTLDPFISQENQGNDLQYDDMIYKNQEISGWLRFVKEAINNKSLEVDYTDIELQPFSTRFQNDTDSQQKLSFIILYFMLYSLEHGYSEGVEAGGGETDVGSGHMFASAVLSRMNKEFKLKMYDPRLTNDKVNYGKVTLLRTSEIITAQSSFDVPVLFDVFDGGLYDDIQKKVKAPISFTKHPNGCVGPLLQPGHTEVRCIHNHGKIDCDQIDFILDGNYSHPYFDNCRNCILWRGLCDKFNVPPLYVLQELKNIGVIPCKSLPTITTVSSYVSDDKSRQLSVEFFNENVTKKHPTLLLKKVESKKNILERLSLKYGANISQVRDMDDLFDFDVGLVQVDTEENENLVKEMGYLCEQIKELEGYVIIAQKNVTLYPMVQPSMKVGDGLCVEPFCEKEECDHPRYYTSMKGSCSIIKGVEKTLKYSTRMGKSGLLYHYSHLLGIEFGTLQEAEGFIEYYKKEYAENYADIVWYGLTINNMYSLYKGDEVKYDNTSNPKFNSVALYGDMLVEAKKLKVQPFNDASGRVTLVHDVKGFDSVKFAKKLGLMMFSLEEATSYFNGKGFAVVTHYEVGYYMYEVVVSVSIVVDFPFSRYIPRGTYNVSSQGGYMHDFVDGKIAKCVKRPDVMNDLLLIDWVNEKISSKAIGKGMKKNGIVVISCVGSIENIMRFMERIGYMLKCKMARDRRKQALSQRILVFKREK